MLALSCKLCGIVAPLTAANCDGSPNRPSLRRESAFRDCASITPASVRFAHVAAGNSFTTAELYPHVVKALGCAPESYTLASLRYDLSKLRAKGLVTKLPNSNSSRRGIPSAWFS
jgi:hypothetical protein